VSRTHGVVATYTNHGCRCDECRAAATTYVAARRARRLADRTLNEDGRLVAADSIEHGTRGGYVNHGCRCVPCTKANAAASNRGRMRRTTV